MRVCLLTEGTYPFVRGGVSTWCRDLIAGLPEIEFTVYAVVGNPTAGFEYDLPENVTRLVTIPLYGHEHLREYNSGDIGAGRRARSTTKLRTTFVPLLRTLIGSLVRGMTYAAVEELSHVFAELYLYFRENDYDWTMRRPEVWDVAVEFFLAEPWHARFMSALEAVELIRALYRYLIPLAIEVPPCDVIHSSVSGVCGTAAVVAKRIYGRPVLLTEHGIYLRERVLELARSGLPLSDRTVKKNLFSSIARATYAASDIIAPVCSYNTKWEHYYGVSPDMIRVVYNGVDETRFENLDRSPAEPTVCAVIRIDPLKDVPTLIASAAVVRTRVPNVRYKIWGPAPDEAYFATCKALVHELNLEDTVTFMGPTSDPAQAYAESHVVALSSISEGFPYSIIEAMMCGKPIAATDVGGVREAVDVFGRIVPPKRPDRLGEAIADLLCDLPAAREIGRGARAHALERFTQTTFLENYRALYAGLYARSATPTPEGIAV